MKINRVENLTILCILALLFPFSELAAADMFYSGPKLISSNGKPDFVLVVDIMGDSDMDLLATAPDNGRILIHVGLGNNSFRSPISLEPGGEPSALAVADLDHNGLKDLVWTDRKLGRLGVFFQLDDSSVVFDRHFYRGEDEPGSLWIQDLDGDGWLDICIACAGADLVSIYWNDQGTIRELESHGVGDGPQHLHMTDWPEPYPSQMVIVQRGVLSRNIVIYDQDMNWLQSLPFTDPTSAASFDWNQDSWPDLLLLDGGAGQGHIYAGEVGGHYGSLLSWPVEKGASVIQDLGSGPEGHLLLIAEASDNRLTFFRDSGVGMVAESSYFIGENLQQFQWLDADGDGVEEIYAPIRNENKILVMENTGLDWNAHHQLGVGETPLSIQQVKDDRGERAAVLCSNSSQIWMLGSTDQLLAVDEIIPVPSKILHMQWGDLDADGLADLAMLDHEDSLHVFFADPSGGYQAISTLGGWSDLRDVELIDLVGDSSMDIVLAQGNPAFLIFLEGDGAGGFVEHSNLPMTQNPSVMDQVDLDADGLVDLLATGEEDVVFLIFNEVDGVSPPLFFPIGTEPRAIGYGKFNSDSLPDIVLGNSGENTFTVLVSTLNLPRLYSISIRERVTPSGSQKVVVDDIDQDGWDDLIFTSPSSRNISVHLNQGNADFSLPLQIRATAFPLDMLPFDANGDGVRDLLILDSLADGVVTLESISSAGGSWDGEDGSSTDARPETALKASSIFMQAPSPNPSSAEVFFRFRSLGELPRLRVFDLRGRLIRRLEVVAEADGWYRSSWSGEDHLGRQVAGGSYFVEMRSGDQRVCRNFLRF